VNADGGETAIIVPMSRCEQMLADVAANLNLERVQGMPAHVTLLYPFVEAAGLGPEVAAEARRALSDVSPFRCEFSTFGRFTDPPAALYLKPVPERPFRTMTALLERAFGTRAYGGAFDDVIPHLTLVESSDMSAWTRVESLVGPAFPIVERVSGFSIYRQRAGAWVEAFNLPFVLGARHTT
jgi:2'-5' RNA ligase